MLINNEQKDLGAETDQAEVEKLRDELREQITIVQRLQTKNDDLLHQFEKSQMAQKKLEKENTALRTKHRVAVQRYEATLRQLKQLKVNYNDLAYSKLGRLTLRFWAWKDKTGKKSFLLFALRWLFERKNMMDASRVLRGTVRSAPVPADATAPEQLGVAAETMPDFGEAVVTSRLEEGVMTPEQEAWIDDYMERIAEIPDSNGCRYYQKAACRIGLICDEFFYESISDAADFVSVTPENWQQVLDEGLDAFLFVTAWRGLHDEWRGLGAVSDMESNPMRKLAIEILDACHEKNIPTVFYSKEDPPNYEVFLDYAKHCDYIYTTAKECIPYYCEDCGRNSVNAVCFGINPINHNPVGFRLAKKEETVLFSGSWMLKYPDRCEELARIFDGILATNHGLHIIDRNYPGDKRYHFPPKYFPYCSPALPHNILQKLHKLFDWAININSVKGSETMFANRAFELQANGVLMMSNYSVGVNNILPNVQMVQESSEVARIMDSLTQEEVYERQIAGIRSVMTDHTCFDRIAQLFAPVGLDITQPARRILVLADELTDAVRMNFERQTYAYKVLMERNAATEEILSEYDMVTWFKSDAVYGTFYLEDMANGFKYTACDYITKDAWMEGEELHEGSEHNYVQFMRSKYRTLFWREAFESGYLLNISDEIELKNGYSIDHFNYNEISRVCAEAKTDYLLTVVVPVYNNGAHLYGKCFASLRRSSMFRDMEILLVDDSSTDEYTLKMEHYLKDTYSNVRIFKFEDRDNDSAARCRSKGVELANGDYITFLEPDNEAVCDGYAQLYEVAKTSACDLVLGNSYRCGFTPAVINICRDLTTELEGDVLEHGIVDALERVGFTSTDVQGMLFSRELLVRTARSDTDDLIAAARTLRLLNTPVFIEYAKTAPVSGKRLMPTLETLVVAGKGKTPISAEYLQNGQDITFKNKDGGSGNTYAWVILLADGAYHKVFSSKYSSNPEFTYNFSALEPGDYKVRAFLKSADSKKSCDIATVRIDEQGAVLVLDKEN